MWPELPDEFRVVVNCAKFAPGAFSSPVCNNPNGGCFDAVLSIGADVDPVATSTPAREDGKGAVVNQSASAAVIDVRRDRACVWSGVEGQVTCTFKRSWLVSAIGEALPAGATISPDAKIALRMVGPNCGPQRCPSSAAPSAAVSLGILPLLPTRRSLLGQDSLQRLAQIARAASTRRDCQAGSAVACATAMGSGRPEERVAATVQLRAIDSRACDAGDGNACNDLATRIEQDGSPQAERDLARMKGCNLNAEHACLILATSLAQDPSTASSALPFFARACTGGEAAACEALATMYESGSVSKDVAKAKNFHTQACSAGDAIACAKVGQRQKACELGDETSCNILCRAGNLSACSGASAELKQIADEMAQKQQAETAVPKLLAKCSSDRATILHWKDALDAAQRSGNPGQAEQASAKLEELQEPWEQLKVDLQQAIITLTSGYGTRFNALRRDARLRCAGHE